MSSAIDNKLIERMERVLDTHDKRYMFLKLTFPSVVTKIQLEGSTQNTCFFIYEHIQKIGKEKELKKTFDTHFPV